MEEQNNKRVRMNVSLTTKGLAQWDCTAEFDTPEKTAEELSKAIKLLKQTVKDNKLKEVGEIS